MSAEAVEVISTPQVYMPILGYVKAELVINCLIVLLVLIVVTLRVIGRLMGPGLGWDDGFVIFATVGDHLWLRSAITDCDCSRWAWQCCVVKDFLHLLEMDTN